MPCPAAISLSFVPMTQLKDPNLCFWPPSLTIVICSLLTSISVNCLRVLNCFRRSCSHSGREFIRLCQSLTWGVVRWVRGMFDVGGAMLCMWSWILKSLMSVGIALGGTSAHFMFSSDVATAVHVLCCFWIISAVPQVVSESGMNRVSVVLSR